MFDGILVAEWSVANCTDIAIQGLEGYVKKCNYVLTLAAINNNNNGKIIIKSKIRKLEERQLYGYFKRKAKDNCTRDDLYMAEKG